MHTGNVGSPYRKVLSQVAERNADEILVNELFIGELPRSPAISIDLP